MRRYLGQVIFAAVLLASPVVAQLGCGSDEPAETDMTVQARALCEEVCTRAVVCDVAPENFASDLFRDGFASDDGISDDFGSDDWSSDDWGWDAFGSDAFGSDDRGSDDFSSDDRAEIQACVSSCVQSAGGLCAAAFNSCSACLDGASCTALAGGACAGRCSLSACR